MANEEQLDILRQGASAWNVWRAKNVKIVPELKGANLQGRPLGGVNFKDVDLQGADLSGVDLAGADFRRANLHKANLRAAVIRSVNARGADLSGAELAGAHLDNASLRDTDLRAADLHDASMESARLDRSDLRQADLRRARLVSATLERAVLSNVNAEAANFSGANLIGADLRSADLVQADFENANLHGADLRGTTGLDCFDLEGARNWEHAFRDPALACGAAIPDPPEDDVTLRPDSLVIGQTVGEPEVEVLPEEPEIPRSDGPYDIVVNPEDRLLYLGPRAGEPRRKEGVSDDDYEGVRDKAREALSQLEGLLERVQPVRHPLIGHNNPPDGTKDADFAPIDEEFRAQLLAVVRSAQQEVAAPYPDKPQVLRLVERLSRAADAIKPYAKMTAEATAKSLGTTLGPVLAVAAVVGAGRLFDALVIASEAVIAWINVLI